LNEKERIPVRNALSVDVEDWFQVGAFENVISRSDWDSLECRVERNTDAVLQMFDGAGVKGTFFTLGAAIPSVNAPHS
jgi:peptidoglycan-N-acetylglucosamine deacetylase